MIVDLFAGPRGWSEGLRRLGLADIGIEIDAAACATAAAAGHLTIRADVAVYPPERFVGAEGVIASPPCQDWSLAGGGAGRAGKTGHLIDTVPCWVEAIWPRWVACEQVPPCLPIWHEHAALYRSWGYRTWAGILNAADYGVPQTRRRAFLLASMDGPALPPAPTHCRGGADTFLGRLDPWVSMADALGWVGEDEPARTLCGDRSPRWLYPDTDGTHGRTVGFPRRDDRGTSPDGYRQRDMRPETEPSHAITGRARSMVVRTGANSQQADGLVPYERPVTEPAPTIDGKAGGAWTLHTNRDQRPDGSRQTVDGAAPAPALTAKAGGQWAFDRPATTIAGDSRCWPPGHKVNEDDRRRHADAIRLTVADALVLQSFRPDYPVQGNKTKQFEQIGNAVPPLLAAQVIAAVTGRSIEAAA